MKEQRTIRKPCIGHAFVPNEDARQRRCGTCYKEQNRANQKAYQQKMRDLLNAVRVSKGCASCGYKANAAALQFDHIVPLGNSLERSSPKTLKQVTALINDPNVQVLCANCHCIKTRENKDYLKRGGG